MENCMKTPIKHRHMKTSSHPLRNAWIHVILAAGSLCCLVPFVLVVIISFTEEKAILQNGYSFFPARWSLAAYRYLLADFSGIVRGYMITILVTLTGTLAHLIIGSMLAYTLSRRDYPYRGLLSFFVFFTMLFNGGLVPWYLVYSNFLHIKDSVFALIVPNLMLSGFNVMVMRTFFQNSIPPSLIESAYLDGAGEFQIYRKIVVPLSRPVLATVGFMVVLNYWNDWYNSLVFMTNDKTVSLQYLMTKVLLNIQALKAQQSQMTPDMLKALGNMPSESIRMAMAVVGAGPMLLIFPFFRKYLVSGLTIGAVKG